MIISPPADSIPSPDKLREALREVIDPEVGMNIVDLGLVYDITVEDGVVCVDMTMTSPACPMGEMIVEDVESVLRAALPRGAGIEVALVWSPPWEPSMMSAEARRHFEW
ncbi:MAG: metal-sulfur cluster assembly factor [Sulfuriferula sp.]